MWIFAGLLLGTAAPASEELMTRFGCYGCHRVADKVIGPPFREIAQRYRSREDATEYLFAKVREGGEGEWGDIPMVANPPGKIPDPELRQLIEWIRSL